MTTALIIGGVLLLGMGMVASELFKLKDWLKKQPAIPNPEPDAAAGPDATPGPDVTSAPDPASGAAGTPDDADPATTV